MQTAFKIVNAVSFFFPPSFVMFTLFKGTLFLRGNHLFWTNQLDVCMFKNLFSVRL